MDPIDAAQDASVRLDELAILRFESDNASTSDKTAISRRQPDDVRHLVRPLEWQSRTSGVRPSALLERSPTLIGHPPVRRSSSSYASICRGSETFCPAFAHTRIYAHFRRRG